MYSIEGRIAIEKNIKYYQENARIIRENLIKNGYKIFGGINAPYIWLKIPKELNSWEFFDILLEKANIIGTPGVGFGSKGEGYFRLTAFGDRDETVEAMQRWERL